MAAGRFCIACLLSVLVAFTGCQDQEEPDYAAFLIDLGTDGERVEIAPGRVADQLPFELILPSAIPTDFALSEIEILTDSNVRADARDLITRARLLFEDEREWAWFELQQGPVGLRRSEVDGRPIDIGGVTGAIETAPDHAGTLIMWTVCDIPMVLRSSLRPPLTEDDLVGIARSTTAECA